MPSRAEPGATTRLPGHGNAAPAPACLSPARAQSSFGNPRPPLHTLRVTLVALASLAACSGSGAARPKPEAMITQTLPVEQMYILETGGVPPNDTIVTFKAGEPRTVFLRHAPPDNTVFAELIFPAGMFADSDATDSVTVAAFVRPGLYGIDIASTLIPKTAGIIRFKYAVHFTAPLGAIKRYGTALRYEQALQVSQEQPDGRYALYRSTRRASDNLEGPLFGPGRYLVGAPQVPAEPKK